MTDPPPAPDAHSHHVFDGSATEELAGYARAVRRGSRIHVSGTTANGADGTALHPGDTGADTAAALRHAIGAVKGLGGGLHDIVRTRIYLAPGADWQAASRAHAEVLGAVRPANTMLHVHALIGDGYLVEVELEAEVVVDP